MQMHVYNQYSSSLTIQGVDISSQNSYAIPTENLKTWLADLTFRMRLCCNLIQIQDELGNAMAIEDVQSLARAIINNEVGTS